MNEQERHDKVVRHLVRKDIPEVMKLTKELRKFTGIIEDFLHIDSNFLLKCGYTQDEWHEAYMSYMVSMMIKSSQGKTMEKLEQIMRDRKNGI